METRSFKLRWALLAGAGLVIAGLFWDAAYHARTPGSEAGWEMAQAHGARWAGLAVGAIAAALALRTEADRRGAFLAALVASLAGLAGHGLDLYAHETEADASLAHLLFLGGELALVVSAVVVSPRSLRLPGARFEPRDAPGKRRSRRREPTRARPRRSSRSRRKR